MHTYKDICIYYLKNFLEKETTLDQDLVMLDGLTLEDGVTYNLRFAIMYDCFCWEECKMEHHAINMSLFRTGSLSFK